VSFLRGRWPPPGILVRSGGIRQLADKNLLLSDLYAQSFRAVLLLPTHNTQIARLNN
jgi:hypothetical protein